MSQLSFVYLITALPVYWTSAQVHKWTSAQEHRAQKKRRNKKCSTRSRTTSARVTQKSWTRTSGHEATKRVAMPVAGTWSCTIHYTQCTWSWVFEPNSADGLSNAKIRPNPFPTLLFLRLILTRLWKKLRLLNEAWQLFSWQPYISRSEKSESGWERKGKEKEKKNEQKPSFAIHRQDNTSTYIARAWHQHWTTVRIVL